MNAMTGNWIQIGLLQDIPRQGSRCINLGEEKIAIFRTVDDQVFALQDKCPHKNGPLSQGIVHDGCVTCPLHNWVISLQTGEAQGADEGKVKGYSVKLDGETILFDLESVR